MPKKKEMPACPCMECHCGKWAGIALILVGALLYLGYGWGVAAMALGVLMLLKKCACK